MSPVVSPRSPTEPTLPIPRFSIRVDDLAHPGAILFFEKVNPSAALREAVIASFTWLYTPETAPTNVESILLVLRSMKGVAHTFGSRTHKEIHVSLEHIQNSADRARAEVEGVLVHEVVHCFQYNGEDKCPGGLIEGIADYVRLHAGYSPPHWKRSGGDKWDAGYETTAYFLDWIEQRYGEGTIRELNLAMKNREYTEIIFKEATGRKVGKLWKLYCGGLEEGNAARLQVLIE